MKEDLLPLEHLQGEQLTDQLDGESSDSIRRLPSRLLRDQLTLEGTYTLHSETAKRNGGDYDFDWVCVIDGDRFPRFVDQPVPYGARTRGHEDQGGEEPGLHGFPSSSWPSSRAAIRLVSITDLMSSCVAAGRHDLLYELVIRTATGDRLAEAQHSCGPEEAARDPPARSVPAPWLALKEAKAINDQELPLSLEVLPTDRIGRLYNILRKHIEELMEKPFPIEQFRGLITGNQVTDRMFEEARLINSVYAAGHGTIQENCSPRRRRHMSRRLDAWRQPGSQATGSRSPREQRAFAKANARYRRAQEKAREQSCSLQSIVRSWGDGKQEDRVSWCQALHTVVSEGKGMGSILFHAFPQEVVDSIAVRTDGIRTQVQCPVQRVRVVVENDCLYSVRRRQEGISASPGRRNEPDRKGSLRARQAA